MLSIVASAHSKIGRWQTYDIFDGLHENIVHTIYQDSDGNLWFGGQDGVSRFNSIRFRAFPFGFSVNDICEDEYGAFWFATNWGAIKFDSSDARIESSDFQRFTVKEGLLHDEVTSVLRDKNGNLWLGTAGGLCSYNGEYFQRFTTANGLADNHVTTLFEDDDGNLWIGTKNGLCRYIGQPHRVASTLQDGGEFQNFAKLETKLRDGRVVKAIQQDKDGRLWVAYSREIIEYNPNTDDFKHFWNIPANAILNAIFIDSEDDLWIGTSVGVARYDENRRKWKLFKHTDGLAEDTILSILEDKEGHLWFGTLSGVSKFEPKCFQNFSADEKLVKRKVSYGDVSVTSICEDRKGNLWFGTSFGGLSRYDGKEFQYFTEDNGLCSNRVNDVVEDSSGNLWIATDNGLCKYDGEQFQTIKQGGEVLSVFAGSSGKIWFALSKDGAGWYDGTLHRISNRNRVFWKNSVSIIEDNNGNVWAVHGNDAPGVTRYDGKNPTNFVQNKDGLLSNHVRTALADSKGNIWFGTKKGVSKSDGKSFKNYRAGLVYKDVRCIMEDRDGNLWFGTHGGGVSKFDGENFQHITTKDGLIHNMVNDILQDSAGNIWIATAGGVTKYTPPLKIPPVVTIANVIADKRYDGKTPLNIPAHIKHVVFTFYAQSFRSRPGGMLYLYQLNKIGEKSAGEWKKTRKNRVEYRIFNPGAKGRKRRRSPVASPVAQVRAFAGARGEAIFPSEVEFEQLKSGRYIFQVQAVDRDLVYSGHPTTVLFSIAPPSYLTPQYYLPIGIGSILLILAFVFVAWKLISHRRRAKQLEKELHQHLKDELDDAHEMQLSLLPQEKLKVEGFDIAGYSVPAKEVGGDFFDYLRLEDGKFGIALADVSGKAMKGAMAAIMTNGMLHAEAHLHDSPAKLLSHLNARLRSRIPKPMFVAFCFAVIDPNSKEMRFANAGCFDPVLCQNGSIIQLRVEGTRIPLGRFADIAYQDIQRELRQGDIILFYSDGIEEAMNQKEETYGYKRIEDVLRNTTDTTTAQDVIDRLLEDVKEFTGGAEQYDDMTLVVVRAL